MRHGRIWGLSVLALVAMVAVIIGVTANDSPAPSAIWVSTHAPRSPSAPASAVFVGDSYTIGAGLTDPSKRWTTLVAQHQGWKEINLGRGGTGYILGATDVASSHRACGLDYCQSYTEMLSDIASAKPEMVVVSGGRNEVSRVASDKWTFSVDSKWAFGVDAFYNALRAALPHAQLVATSPIWDDGPVPEVLRAMKLVVQRAVTRVGGFYVDLGDPLLGRKDCVADDGTHPNEAGHAVIANAFNKAYASKRG